MNEIKVSIIVCFTDTYNLLNNFFEHMSNNVLQNRSDYELILVQDSHCTLRTIQLVKEFKQRNANVTKIFEKPHLGFSKANNLGVKSAKGEYLIFLNTDVFPEKTAIDSLCKELLNEKTAIVQGLLLYPHNNTVQTTGHTFIPFDNKHLFMGKKMDDPIVQQKAVRQGLSAAFYGIKKSVFHILGMFDEKYFNGWEGLDICLQANLRGYQCVYLPSALAYHVQGSSRDSIYRNDKFQMIYFREKWGAVILTDFHEYILAQLTPDNVQKSYTIINCSTASRDIWKPLLDELNVLDILQIQRYSESERIVLDERINLYELASKGPVIYIVDHFSQIINNHRTFSIKNSSYDLIIDFHANVLAVPTTSEDRNK